MKAKKLINIAKIVKDIMQTDTQARNSDSILYLRVLQRVTEATECPINVRTMSVKYFLENMNELDFPPFESVRRTRQKIQRDHPELRACEVVEIGRMENEKEYRAYARGGMTI